MTIAILALLLQSQDPLDRLIAELKGTSERQEMARFALRAYGEAAIERLKKEGLDPKLVGDLDPSVEDKTVVDRLKSVRISIALEGLALSSTLEFLGRSSNLNIRMDESVPAKLAEAVVSFRGSDLTMDATLRLILAPHGLRYRARDGRVVILAGTGLDARPPCAPVRVLADHPDARKRIAELSSETPEDREKANEEIRRLGFSAEPALWKALDSEDPEIRGRATELLRELYAPDPKVVPAAVEKTLKKKTLNYDLMEASPAKALEFLSDATGVSILVDAREKLPARSIAYQWKALPADQLLKELCRQAQRDYLLIDDWIFVTNDARRVLGTHPHGSVWVEPGKARRIEEGIGKIVSGDVAEDIFEMDPIILGPLLQASRILPRDAAERCRRARERYIDRWDFWMADEPSGAERQKLTDAHRALLEKPIDLVAVDEPLVEVLKKAGLAATLRPTLDLRFHLWTKRMKAGTLLKALTGPYGLDFVLDGETIVIDVASRIRDMIK